MTLNFKITFVICCTVLNIYTLHVHNNVHCVNSCIDIKILNLQFLKKILLALNFIEAFSLSISSITTAIKIHENNNIILMK